MFELLGLVLLGGVALLVWTIYPRPWHTQQRARAEEAPDRRAESRDVVRGNR
jgi:hypothetical protein